MTFYASVAAYKAKLSHDFSGERCRNGKETEDQHITCDAFYNNRGGRDSYQKQRSDEHGSTGQLLRLLARPGQKDSSSSWFRSNLGSM